MSHDEIANIEMMVRVKDFGARRPGDFPPTGLGGQALEEVATALSGLEQHATTQHASSGGSRLGTANRATARTALRRAVREINQTAHAIGLDIPGIENKFRMPRSGDQNLLNAARAFLQDAAPLKDAFIKHEMPADFLEELKRLLDAFQAAVIDQHRVTETRINATASVDVLMEGALRAIDRLDVIVKNKYRDDPATLSVWASASHVEHHNARPRKKTEPATPPASEPTGKI